MVLQSILWRAGLISCDQRVDLLISVFDPRQLHCIRDLYHNFKGNLLMTVMIHYIWPFFSDLDRETGGTKLNKSIKGINLARCFWFTPTISAPKSKAKRKKVFVFFCFVFCFLSQQLIESVNQDQWWGLLTKTQIGGWRETNGLSENQ